MKTFKNILLINFGGIGDEILFLPTIKSLKKTYPNSTITLVLEPRSGSIKNLSPIIDNTIGVDIKGKHKYFELLKFYFKALFGRYDLVVSSGGNKLIPFLLYFTGIKTRIGYDTGLISQKLLTQTPKLNQNQYAGKMYHDLIQDLTKQEYQNPEIVLEDEPTIQNSVIVHPGVSKMSIKKNIIKSWSNLTWAKLIEQLLKKGKNVMLAGGPDDKECIEEIREYLKDKNTANFSDMYGKTKNIIDLAKLIKKNEILICSDSAPMHIGVATDTRTIAIFGPTDESKLLPKSEKYTAIKNNIHCRPCLWDKRQTSCETKECLDLKIEQITELL
ncbi:MAG: glycosyltransferase family 9 protein [Candidatus Gastranaerophilales bacterium]|nr:glycosyltransferase family 9 protein [Candidatus Gastranaerophilales bacterium]